MTAPSTGQSDLFDEIHSLVTARLHGDLTPERLADFDRLLAGSGEARRLYVQYIYETLALPVLVSAESEQHSQPSPFRIESGPSHVPTWPGMIGYLSSGWPVAYLIATVIFGLGLLIGSHVYMSQPVQVAGQSAPLPPHLSPLPSMVGRITGMVDCRWVENPKSEIRNPKSLVSLGDRFALASGLMEITYDTGAKVILQGPVTYEVESVAGGYLSVGKLTAKLEKNDKSGTLNAERSASSSSFIVHRSSFAVRTPTAIVTDLGTEFGVEVGKSGLPRPTSFAARSRSNRPPTATSQTGALSG